MKTQTIHAGKQGTPVTPLKYNTMRAAMLKVIPRRKTGISWDELVAAIAPNLPAELFPHLGSVRWYCKAVQLDLEAKGVIERLPGSKPLRFRRL